MFFSPQRFLLFSIEGTKMKTNERNAFALLAGSASALVTTVALLIWSAFLTAFVFTFSNVLQSVAVVVVFYLMMAGSLIYAKFLPKKSFALFSVIGLVNFVALQFQNLLIGFQITSEYLLVSLVVSMVFAFIVPFLMLSLLVKAEILH
jgi:hypothetical protein